MRQKFFTLAVSLLVFAFAANAQKQVQLFGAKTGPAVSPDAIEVAWAAKGASKDAYTYNPGDSPLPGDYSSNTYDELGWTDIAVSESGVAGNIEISYTWDTDSWPAEGSFLLESPAGTSAVVGAGESDGTYNKVLTDFTGEELNGNWKLWIEDSYGDGGHQATSITVIFNTAPDNDLAVMDITPTFVQSYQTVTPHVTVQNGGALEQTSFDLQLTDGSGYDETITFAGTLASGADTALAMPDWTPADGSYTLTAAVTLAGDEDTSNDTLMADAIVTAFGAYAVAGNTSAGTYNKANLNTGGFTEIGTIGSDPFPMAEEFGNDTVYRIYADQSIVAVNYDDGTTTSLGTMTGFTGTPTALAYDHTNDIMYLTYLDGSSVPHFGTLDLDTYAFTEIGQPTGQVIGMDLADDGYVYAPTLDDNLIQIDPATGTSTDVGPLGIDINYGQDVTFDEASGMLLTHTVGAVYQYGYYDMTTGAFMQLADGSGDQIATLTTYAGPALYDVVFNVVDAGTNPLQNATVTIDGQDLMTNANGEAWIQLADGDYDYSVSLDGYQTVTGTVNVAGGAVAEPVVLEVANTVTFTVVDEDTNPLEGANININGMDLTTDDLGVATIDLVDDTYDYTVSLLGYDDYTDQVTVAGAPVDVDVTMIATLYTVTFTVEDEDTNPLEGATVTVDGSDYTTNASGEATMDLVNGSYAYTVTMDGYEDGSGTIFVNNGPVTQTVTLIAIPPSYTVTFNVDMNTPIAMGMFEPGVDTVIVAGSMNGWTTPGDDPAMFMEDANDDGIYTVSMDLMDGDYEYKYFKGAGWDNGEWQGGDNRMMTVAGDVVTLDDVWGMEYLVTFMVTEADAAAEGAMIVVEGDTTYTDVDGYAWYALQNGDYEYMVSLDGYAPVTDSVTVMDADVEVPVNFVGINDAAQATFKVYPNPTSGMINVVADGQNTVTILNAIGKVVSTQQINGEGTIDLTNNASGVYFIRLQTDNNVATQRVVVE